MQFSRNGHIARFNLNIIGNSIVGLLSVVTYECCLLTSLFLQAFQF